ncbi:MAG: hypothetical protein CHACPFDD_04144 [Phycisphaerae bacterium]|nr:hypothetical protein [Phycisphaerae bacterium]
MNRNRNALRRRHRVIAALSLGGVLMQLIPFSCGQPILRAVTPFLMDDAFNILDRVIFAVAPLVLP